MADYLTLRRYCLNKRSAAKIRREGALESLWKSKQLAEPGTDLPDDFPSREALTAEGYTTKEDLEGADAEELTTYVKLGQREAEKVMAAYAAL